MKVKKTKWTLGILTVPPRAVKLQELMDVLTPQITEEVQVIVLYNNFEKPIGELRQQIVDQAKGQYISFIDDDDLVPADFVATILPHLNGKNDYVGFKIALFNNGIRMRPVYHSLKYTDWSEDEQGYYRDITHLNPLKIEIARQATFTGGSGEDVAWANQLRGKAKKEVFIDREMYEYRHSQTDTLSGGPRPGDIQRDFINRIEEY